MNNRTTKITIFEDAHISVWVYPERHIVHHRIHKFVYGQTFRDALTAGTDAMRQYQAYKWLSDDSQNTAVPKADQDWGNTVWFPRCSHPALFAPHPQARLAWRPQNGRGHRGALMKGRGIPPTS